MNPNDRYHRQMLFPGIGEAGQERIKAAHVAVVGVGALGTVSANLLARAGVGRLSLIDRDYVELTNLQRQVLFDEDDLASGLPKAAAATERLRRVNSTIAIAPVVVDLTSANAEALLAPPDLVIDGTDNFEARYLINDVRVKHGRPWIYAGAIASEGSVWVIRPGQTPCLRCVFAEPPAPGTTPTCDTAGVLGPAVGVVASWQVAEALKLLVGAEEAVSRQMLYLNVWTGHIAQVDPGPLRADCPTCQQRRFEYLDSRRESRSIQLCGRDAVQIGGTPGTRLDLADLAERLRNVGEVEQNRFLLKLRVNGHELRVFPDGRAIVQGTTDFEVARALYARYVGA